MKRIYLSLGSNIANPEYQINTALKAISDLPNTNLIASSSWYRSRPMGPQNQPDFLNIVVMLDTSLNPQILLYYIQKIENQQGRIRQQRWGPRSIDIDILLFGEDRIKNSRLIIPHYDIYNRLFVLYPLYELDYPMNLLQKEKIKKRLIQDFNTLQYWDNIHRLCYY
ncbi:2-amino-4-hydroxy-6-hydroxymethyldihydropteridine diphosphokinase [Candidatus Schneideria nysicola]|uniref:2-amino-4-hydroxy-6- hydroxymethyldihydropteridine diphosphokinase n=1 Tax=Candidatus Schneideria nysicola TaxID=1081631 RepID=UPI001CAA7EE4|nr:2-amino-4-hydroxy-6-hydroxymethyldihydropteridine diphosphokinase [Candidatus Schneideria nysicola]UAJ65693.1 2-amino-4-hydroxy-6-hydroxymethyldihydropteridine diphosphokinase [Candidatus Schneideria nysicola]